MQELPTRRMRSLLIMGNVMECVSIHGVTVLVGGESPAGRVRILGSAKSSMSRHLSPDHRPVKIIDNTCKVGLRWSGEISKIRDRLKQTNPSPL